MTTSPLVSTQWLADHLDAPDVVVVNAWMPPLDNPAAKPEYFENHIPGSVFFDVNAICDSDNPLPHMLPQPHVFASEMRKLGIGDGQTIVVYDGYGIYCAPRVWWTFKAFGARRVYVLNGGLPKWIAEGRATDDQTPARSESHFTARLDHSFVRDLADMKTITSDGSMQILDARSSARFSGTAPEPRAGLRSGHMPGALNLPFTEVVRDGKMRDVDALKKAFDQAGVTADKPIVTTCGSGVTAAVLSLALLEAGLGESAVYDGSWSEWGGRDDVEIVTD